jgi:hypothetical protein
MMTELKKIQMGMNVIKKSFKLKNICFVFTQSDTILRHVQRMKVWQANNLKQTLLFAF